jgi:hypothetical protein
MSFYSSASHLELFGNFGIIAALQKQFDDLLFARPKPNGLLAHHFLPPGQSSSGHFLYSCIVSRIHSIYLATFRESWM